MSAASFRMSTTQGFDKRLKCSIFDWGDRFTNPVKHLEEVVEYFDSIGGVPKWMQVRPPLHNARCVSFLC